MRGRLDGTKPVPGNATDLGRPSTFGATAWLEVEPHGTTAWSSSSTTPSAPGRRRRSRSASGSKDPDGAPLAGEVTLWLVDQAVLALGREQRLDPVPSLPRRGALASSRRATRARWSSASCPSPSGRAATRAKRARTLLDRQTVRKNFQAVPYYNPTIVVGPDGTARVKVRLPDDLTNFKLRAKAVSGPERFGFATGKLEVRQPVVVQPALPRFVRPGDRFLAGAIGRLVEGDAGPGKVVGALRGCRPSTGRRRSRSTGWRTAPRASTSRSRSRLPGYDADGQLTRERGGLPHRRRAQLGRRRRRVRDPPADARRPGSRGPHATSRRSKPGTPGSCPRPAEAARPGLAPAQAPGLQRARHPRARLGPRLPAALPLRLHRAAARRRRAPRWRSGASATLLHLEGGEAALDRAVKDTLDWMPLVEQPSGLVAYWPGRRGSVSLTAWTAEFLAEAREGGYTVDAEVAGAPHAGARAGAALRLLGLRRRRVVGRAHLGLCGRSRALGKFDAAYGNELARRAQFLDLENVANVVTAFDRAGYGDRRRPWRRSPTSCGTGSSCGSTRAGRPTAG